MNKLLIASTRKGSGKTSLIVGIAAAMKEKYAYLKPFGDRLIYRRKKNWDYDSGLIKNLWMLEGESDDITLGFNHSKLRYVYNKESIKNTLLDMVKNAGSNKNVLFIEGGQDLSLGTSINLDSLSIARFTDSKVIMVISGDNDVIFDDINYIKRYLVMKDIHFSGIILNKVQDVEDFKSIFLKPILDMGIKVLGIIPFRKELTYFSIQYISDKLFAKIIAGEKGLNNYVKNIFVGAMSTGKALRNPLFKKEATLLITSGDRSDMILVALENDTAGLILTNNIVPPSNIISKASERNIPLLLVKHDTYQVAKKIDRMEALLTTENTDKIDLLAQLTKKYLKINDLLK